MEISQYTWSRQTVVLSGRDGSDWRLSLTVHQTDVLSVLARALKCSVFLS